MNRSSWTSQDIKVYVCKHKCSFPPGSDLFLMLDVVKSWIELDESRLAGFVKANSANELHWQSILLIRAITIEVCSHYGSARMCILTSEFKAYVNSCEYDLYMIHSLCRPISRYFVKKHCSVILRAQSIMCSRSRSYHFAVHHWISASITWAAPV